MRTLFFITILMVSLTVKSQDITKVKDASRVTFYGLDFSKAKMVGTIDIDFKEPEKIVNQYFKELNSILFLEIDKYKIERAIGKNVVYLLDPAINNSMQVDPNQLVTITENFISEDEVKEIIGKYGTGERDGVGMLMIVENYNKPKEIGKFIVVFFDETNGDIFISQHVSGKAKGLGFRNYWSKCTHGAIKQIKKEFHKRLKE